jgi:cell division protein FtsZ
MTLNLRMPEVADLKPRITVFGVGGAGGNAVNNMIDQDLQGVDFVVANTDAQALQQNKATSKIQLGEKATEGLGAGAQPSVGALAAEESIETIVDYLAGAHMCFITAGMGGGTGTGAAPIIAQTARELGILTVGVVTKPFQFEGTRRMRQAEEGVEALQKMVDTLIIIPNQNLFRVANEKTTFTEAFSMADDVLYQGVKGVTDLMVRPGLINLDFADIRSVMDEMGKAMMGTGEAEGEDRAIQAAEKAIANPLLDEISLEGARGVLINVTGGHDLTLFEMDEAANRIREKVDDEANIIVGSTLDTSLDGMMRVSVVATGIDVIEGLREETPRPRRTMKEPMQMPAAEETPAPVASAPVAEPAPVAAPTYAAAPAAPAPAHAEVARQRMMSPSAAQGQEDRDLFAPLRPETSFDDSFDDSFAPAFDAADDMPAPAYQPEVQDLQSDIFAEAAEEAMVAPQRPLGEPSQDTLDRLRSAVEKVPSQEPLLANRRPVEEAAPAKAGFRLRDVISRISGYSGDENAEHHEHGEPSYDRSEPSMAQEDPEMDNVEVPAFLRRQAN